MHSTYINDKWVSLVPYQAVSLISSYATLSLGNLYFDLGHIEVSMCIHPCMHVYMYLCQIYVSVTLSPTMLA